MDPNEKCLQHNSISQAYQCWALQEAPESEPDSHSILDLGYFTTQPENKPTQSVPKIHCMIFKACPGLTDDLDPRMGVYLETTSAEGAGAISIHAISEKHFGKSYVSLTHEQRLEVCKLEKTYQTWQNDTLIALHKAVYTAGATLCVGQVEIDAENSAPIPLCAPCTAVLHSNSFKAALCKK